MKTTIKIKNFKKLEDVEIELAPTTVLLGPNGAGKSSFLKLMHMLETNLYSISSKQSIKNNFSSQKDIGSFENIVTNNDLNRKISVEIIFDNIILDKQQFAITTEKTENNLKSSDANTLENDRSSSFEEELPFRLFSSNWYDKLNELDVEEAQYNNRNVKDGIKFLFSICNNNSINSFEYKISYNAKNYYLLKIDEENDKANIKLKSGDKNLNRIFSELTLPAINFGAYDYSLFNFVLQDYFKCVKKLWEGGVFAELDLKQLEDLVLNGLFELFLIINRVPDIYNEWGNPNSFSAVRDTKNIGLIRKRNNDNSLNWFDLIPTKEFVYRVLKIMSYFSEDSEWLSGKTMPPKEFYTFYQEEFPEIVAAEKNKDLLKYIKPPSGTKWKGFISVVPFINEIKYQIELLHYLKKYKLARAVFSPVVDDSNQLKVITNTGAVIDYSDSSSGMIQFFPILYRNMTMIAYTNYTSIEQPELHLHPKLQGQMAELFIKGKFIIETHSEHLIRGFQLMVARKELNKERIKFYYFDDTKGTTEVTKLELDDYGNFTRPWPQGFFDDANNLALQLLEAQIARRN